MSELAYEYRYIMSELKADREYEYEYDRDYSYVASGLLGLVLVLGFAVCGCACWLYLSKRRDTLHIFNKSKNLLVGMVGHAGHGKDSVGNILVKNGFVRDAFAKPLKDAARVLWLLSDDQLYGDKKEVEDPRWGTSPRVLLQLFGTEVGRELFGKWMPHIGERFWLEHFKTRRSDLLRNQQTNLALSSNIVVCDVRFPNEAELIKELGGVLVKVVRPNHNAFLNNPSKPTTASSSPSDEPIEPVEPVDRGCDSQAPNIDSKEEVEVRKKAAHKSEMLIDSIEPDLVILNDGTLQDLEQNVHERLVPLLLHPPIKKIKRTRKCD